MKLLFENWRRYILNEITLDQARERLETKVIKKIIKSSIYDLKQEYGDPFNLADDELEDMVVFEKLLESEAYVKVFAKIYGYVLDKIVMSLDLDDREKGTALNWLISVSRTDKKIPDAVYSENPQEFSYNFAQAITSEIMQSIIDIADSADAREIKGRAGRASKIYDINYLAGIVDDSYDPRYPPSTTTQYSVDSEEFQIRNDLFRKSAPFKAVAAEVYSVSRDHLYEYIRYIKGPMEKFFHYQQFMPEKDINKIKTFEEFVKNTEDASDAIERYQNKKSYEDVDQGTEIFRDDDDFFIAAIHNKGAACHWGKETDWCTAAPGLDYFRQYYSVASPIIVLIDKKAKFISSAGRPGGPHRKYQFHYATEQFMDARDMMVKQPQQSYIHREIMKTDIPHKYANIKSDFLEMVSQSRDYYWAAYTDLGWPALDKVLAGKIPSGLMVLSRLEARDQAYQYNYKVYENYITNKIKQRDLGAITTIIIARYIFDAFGLSLSPASNRGPMLMAHQFILDNIEDVLEAIPEDKDFFKAFPLEAQKSGVLMMSSKLSAASDSMQSFLRNREYYEKLPNNLKEKYVRLINIADEASRETTNVSWAQSAFKTIGVPQDRQNGGEEEKEDKTEITERWKKLSGVRGK